MAWHVMAWHGMAWHGMAWQGRAGQGRAGQGMAWHGRAGQGRVVRVWWAGQGRAGQGKARGEGKNPNPFVCLTGEYIPGLPCPGLSLVINNPALTWCLQPSYFKLYINALVLSLTRATNGSVSEGKGNSGF